MWRYLGVVKNWAHTVVIDRRCHMQKENTLKPSLYLCLSAVSLRVSLKSLSINADGGSHPSAAPAHPKYQAGCVSEDDP